jgi:hypothetical protein
MILLNRKIGFRIIKIIGNSTYNRNRLEHINNIKIIWSTLTTSKDYLQIQNFMNILQIIAVLIDKIKLNNKKRRNL